MALHAPFSPILALPTRIPSLNSPKTPPTTGIYKAVRCAVGAVVIDDPTVTRRSAKYLPSVWDYDFVQSLASDYTDEKYMKQVERLKDDVRPLINGVMDPLARLELIDAI
ncbi:hypothetical protein L1049_024887 [Liquidambar formosana]|uniref:Uncharacterized protein n=1 Tax=Liquidambar formosana TaxID=63359 RepID=A0AAP0RWG1_LIQFO